MPTEQIITEAPETKKIKTVSFSRLSVFNKCPRLYNYKYVNKIVVIENLKEPLIKGSLSHYILEQMLHGHDAVEAFYMVLPTWLVNICRLEVTDDPTKAAQGFGICPSILGEYAEAVSDLLLRCAINYKGTDVIRTDKGGVPADPLNYPPKSFKQEYRDLGLDDLKFSLDLGACRGNEDFANLSLSFITAQALFFAKNFKYPERFGKSIGIEHELYPTAADDYEPVPFFDKYWNGAIDWVYESLDDELIIADHKSSKKCMSETEVLYHPQLNLYAALYYEQTGRFADKICINHLPSNTFVEAKPELTIVNDYYNYFKQLQTEIDKSDYTRRIPTEYNSPCIEYKYVGGQSIINNFCPYLTHCWPNIDLENLRTT